MHKGVFPFEKREGETPLAALERFREAAGIAPEAPLTYAGRLDPMASGLLLILSGESIDRKAAFLGLEKAYEFEVLLGVGTDTGDILGLVSEVAAVPADAAERVSTIAASFVGTFPQRYPRYSSKTVDGVPLWKLSREGNLSGALPEHAVTVREIAVTGVRTVSGAALLDAAAARIGSVAGDFRQKEIVERWKETLAPAASFFVVSCAATVSAGTYVRVLAEDIGGKLGVPALALSIRRVRVGDHML